LPCSWPGMKSVHYSFMEKHQRHGTKIVINFPFLLFSLCLFFREKVQWPVTPWAVRTHSVTIPWWMLPVTDAVERNATSSTPSAQPVAMAQLFRLSSTWPVASSRTKTTCP
jgi:hypothetical protein